MKPIITGKVMIAGVLAWLGIVPWSTAQQVFYNGASVYVEPGAHIYVQGGFTNQGTGQVTHKGTITVTGDWENNAGNNVFVPGDTGVVVLAGTTQSIQGTTPTHFARLTLANNSVKSLNVNTEVTDILDLDDCELNTNNFVLTVSNPATNAIVRTTGYVATDSAGMLARATNSSSVYQFPMGSSQGVTRYRPVDVAPANASANTFGVAFLNYSGNNDSAFTFNAVAPACYVNDNWFHKVYRTTGSASADLTFYFDDVADSTFNGLANFQFGQWQPQAGATLVSNVSPAMSTLSISNVSSFTNRPWALYLDYISTGITALSATTVCQGSTVTLASTVNSVSYDWHVNGVSLPLNQNNSDTIYATVAGTYYAVHDNGICTDTSNTIVVTLNALPNTAITSPGTLCVAGSAVNLQAATPGGTWSGTGITSSSQGTFDPSVAGIGSASVVYELTDANNCYNADTIQITVNPLPDAGFTTSVSLCSNGAPVLLTPNTPGGTFNGTGIINGATGSFDPSVAGAGSVAVTYTVSANGCQNSATQNLTVNAAPVITFGSSPSICGSSSPVNLSATPASGTWSGPGITNPTVGTFDPVAAGGTGNYTVVYAYTDGNNCTGVDSITIPVAPLPDASFNIPGTLCSNGSPVTFVPTTPGGTWSGSGVGSSNGVFDPSAVSPGSIPVSYTVVVSGCSNTSTQNVVVNAVPNVNITSIPSTVCANAGSVQLLATPVGGLWSGNGVGSTGLFNPSIVGVGQVQVVYAVSQNGCSGSDSAMITVLPLPDAGFNIQSPICASAAPITLTANTPGGSFSGPGIVANTFNPSIGPGTHSISYNVTSANGCQNTSVQTVVVEALPFAQFSTSTIGNLSYSFDASGSNGTVFSWDFGDGSNGSGVITTHTYAAAGSYPVILTVSNSCGSSQSNFTLGSGEALNVEQAVQVYPNPFFATTGVDITLQQSDVITIEVYDMLGRKMGATLPIQMEAGTTRVDLGPEFFSAASANYFIHVMNGKGELNVTKVIKLN